ncbi:MAG: hypothetical protein JNK15_13615 [Planctomycetes bacterium]|nr:hypothetical protein [Planctomycetota bacterium]
MRTVLPMACAILVLAGCGHDPGPGNAHAAFASFQQALRQKDEAACRALLTQESAAVLADMPWDRVASQPALEVLGARTEGHEYRVQVADPAAGGKQAEFVVVREHGKLVVDLVASAALTAEIREASGSKEELAPRELTPADHDRIRQWELAQPRR